MRGYTYDPSTSLHRISLPLLSATLAEVVIPAQHLAVTLKSIALQCLDGLAYLHALNIGHRDINPKNIMFDWQGTIKLVDFSTAFAPGLCATSEQHGQMVCQVGTG